MAEYIEREALLQDIEETVCFTVKAGTISNEMRGANKIIDRIKCAPAADVVPVVHGAWDWFDEDTGSPISGYEREWGWRCSNCKTELSDDFDNPDYLPEMNFCPNCGAKMDEEVAE